MKDCVFCKIIAGEAPGDIVYSDEQVTAFHDIHPVAPVHILVVPNKHIASTNEITNQDEQLVGHMLYVAQKIAEQKGVQQSGYRLILNTGPDAGQVIFHLHLHLIGGQHMRYPMG
jgi:histidine triad (HIT) family protein